MNFSYQSLINSNHSPSKAISLLLGKKDDLINSYLIKNEEKSKQGFFCNLNKEQTDISFTQKNEYTQLKITYTYGEKEYKIIRGSNNHINTPIWNEGFLIQSSDNCLFMIEDVLIPVFHVNENLIKNEIDIIFNLPQKNAKTLINKIYKSNKIKVYYKLIEKSEDRVKWEKKLSLSIEDTVKIEQLNKVIKSMDFHYFKNDIELSKDFLILEESFKDFSNDEIWIHHELKILDYINFLNSKMDLNKEVMFNPTENGITEILRHNEENFKFNLGSEDDLYAWITKRELLNQSFFLSNKDLTFQQDYDSIMFSKIMPLKNYYKNYLIKIKQLENL